MGAAACVYNAHIESPSAPRRRPITASCTAVGLLPLLREEFRLFKLILHSELRRRAASRRALPCPSSHILLWKKIPLFTPKLCGLDIWPGPQIARSVRSAAAPARPMGAAACVYNTHIESPSDTPSLPETGRRRGAATNAPCRRPITARCTAVGLLPLLRE